jgi:hypothetical protein
MLAHGSTASAGQAAQPYASAPPEPVTGKDLEWRKLFPFSALMRNKRAVLPTETDKIDRPGSQCRDHTASILPGAAAPAHSERPIGTGTGRKVWRFP